MITYRGNGVRIWSLASKAALHHEQRADLLHSGKQAICGATFFSGNSGHSTGEVPPLDLHPCPRCAEIASTRKL